MGSKGSSSGPAPDPRLVEAQIRSMGIQDQAIQRLLANSEYLQPLQRDQMQFGLDAAKTGYQQSQEDRSWMLGRRNQLAGVQDQLVSEARSFDTEAKREELAGQAAADATRSFDAARAQSMRAQMARGVNPASGQALALGQQAELTKALGLTAAKNNARTAARVESRGLLDRANNALAGYPAMSMQATGQGAGLAGSGINLVNNAGAGMNAGVTQAGQVAGQMGSNATSMWGAQANREANLQGESGWGNAGSIMGGIASMYGAFSRSDRRLKQDIEPVGQDERTGLPLYEFAYKTDPARRFRGVMADEVRAKFPDAVQEDESGFLSVNYAALGIPFAEVGHGLDE